MTEPPAEVIKQLKEQFSDRVLRQVELVADDKPVLTVVMTGPDRGEFSLFTKAVQKAKGIADEDDRSAKLREAVETAALVQIRWPSKEECQKVFRLRPLLVDGFAEELSDLAGANVEHRRKNL